MARAKAARDEAARDLERKKELIAKDSIPKATFDRSQADVRAGHAAAHRPRTRRRRCCASRSPTRRCARRSTASSPRSAPTSARASAKPAWPSWSCSSRRSSSASSVPERYLGTHQRRRPRHRDASIPTRRDVRRHDQDRRRRDRPEDADHVRRGGVREPRRPAAAGTVRARGDEAGLSWHAVRGSRFSTSAQPESWHLQRSTSCKNSPKSASAVPSSRR